MGKKIRMPQSETSAEGKIIHDVFVTNAQGFLGKSLKGEKPTAPRPIKPPVATGQSKPAK